MNTNYFKFSQLLKIRIVYSGDDGLLILILLYDSQMDISRF